MKILRDAHPLLKKKSQAHISSSSFLAFCVGNSVTPMSTLAKNKRSCSKSGKFQAKLRFSCFSGEKLARDFVSSGMIDLVGREPLVFARVENGVT